MKLENFFIRIENLDGDYELLDFCRKYLLHGTPYVFEGRDGDFYEFRKEIGTKFEIPYHEVFITGSGKLGFSPFKNKEFDYDSDIDVAIISPSLFEKMMSDIASFQMRVRENRDVVQKKEIDMYHSFLEYVALGWIRPDKLPISFQMKGVKDDWFKFFRSISFGKSSVGNYQVNAGVFKSYSHIESYTFSGLKKLKQRRILKASYD